MPLRQRIETSFETWGHFIVRQRWLAILLVLGTTAVLVSWLPEMKVDNSVEAFLHSDDPERLRYDRFRDRFDRDDRIIIILNPPEIFDLGFLEKLRAFHRDLERELPYTEEITSLLNARYTHGEADELIVEDLLEDWPDGPADLAALRERVLANPLYINLLISENAAFTTVTINPGALTKPVSRCWRERSKTHGRGKLCFQNQPQSRKASICSICSIRLQM